MIELSWAKNVADACFSQMNYRIGMASTLVELNIDTERAHQELLELLSSQTASSDSGSSVGALSAILFNIISQFLRYGKGH
jgi:hypothetical protein